MRAYPHKVDEEILGENRQAAEEFIDQLTPEAPGAELEKNATFFKMLGKEMLSYGIYSYASAEPTSKVIEKLQQANLYFTKAIAFEIIMDPYEYIDYLALAIILTDAPQARHLAAFPRTRYSHEDVEAGEIIYLLSETMGLLLLASKELAERLAAAQQELAAKKMTRYDRLIAESLIGLIAAIAARDQNAFNQAVLARQQDFKRAHGHPSERDMPEALLDIPGLALVRLALARGLKYTTQSSYLPVELLQR
ncbi:MAG: Imm49 family immunity protein [Candidatus Contendobacter sp.]|nr:Imm49 family immunity protein [Candidatus Contendobacter sp.]